MNWFATGTITAYPTDTSFGLAVRSDDAEGLAALYALKGRPTGQPVSLMVRDFNILKKYAYVPKILSESWFVETPRTAILRPKDTLPTSFAWPAGAVGFRVCLLSELRKHLPDVPITTTSANKSGQSPCFTVAEVEQIFGDKISICTLKMIIPKAPPSQIWDFTKPVPERIR